MGLFSIGDAKLALKKDALKTTLKDTIEKQTERGDGGFGSTGK